MAPVRTLILVLAAAGCGTGTITGSGGSGGNGGIGGAGGQIVAELPNCLRDLMAPCPFAAPCHFNLAPGGVPERACYAGGAVASFTHRGSCPPTEDRRSLTIEVLKSDGSACYSWEMDFACTGAVPDAIHTWRDASGTVVAIGRDLPSFRVTCTATGETCIAPLQTDGSEPCAMPQTLGSVDESCRGDVDGGCYLPLPAR
jgi:hypothetical protein